VHFFASMASQLPLNRRLGISPVVDGVAGGHRFVNGSSFGKALRRTDPLKLWQKEMFMKKYIKPSLTGLGLLRVVTKFSVCVPSAFYVNCKD
jgi:hypothetical protein